MFMKWLTANLSQHRIGRWRALMVIVLSIVMVFTAGCSLLPPETEEEELPIITPPRLSQKPEYTVRTDTLETKVRGVGKLMSLKEEELVFIDGGRRIKEMYVRVGEFVHEGELIAELDVTELENQLRTQKLHFRSEEIAMIETLRKADELSAEELEQAKIAFELKRTNLVELEESIARARITAPFSGHIISVAMGKGDTPQAYDTVATIADLTQLTVAANISADDQKKIAVGMTAEVDISTAGVYTGTITRMPVEKPQQPYDPWNPRPQPKDVIENYVVVELEEFPDGLNRGTPLSVSVVVERKEDVVVIPPAALRTHLGRTYVQVVDEEGNKSEVDVEVGQQTSTLIEIVKGLEPGQKVVGR